MLQTSASKHIEATIQLETTGVFMFGGKKSGPINKLKHIWFFFLVFSFLKFFCKNQTKTTKKTTPPSNCFGKYLG